MKGFILLVFSLIAIQACAQTDSTEIIEDTTGHSIKKAIIFSAILPGAGQVYNHIAMPKGRKKAFWKVPLVYAGLGVSTYYLITNQKEVSAIKTEYYYRQDNNGATSNPELVLYGDNALLTLHSQYSTWRDLSILALAGVYVLQIVDAGVEAHFVSFDISEDLSMNVSPTILNARTAGLKMTFNFH